MSWLRRSAGAALIVGGVLAITLANIAGVAPSEAAAGWWVAAGFAACALGLALLKLPAESWVLALAFSLYIGVSAALAATGAARDDVDSPTGFSALGRVLLFASETHPGPQLSAWAFYPTLKLASACGLLCIAAFVAAAHLPGRVAPRATLESRRLAQAANMLIAAGIAGALLAGARFLATHHGAGLSTSSLQSFWHGGAYLVLLGQFAIPGFGLRLSLQLERRAGRRAILSTAGCFALFLLLSVPTGERGFLIEGGIVAVAVLARYLRWVRLLIVPAVIVGLIGLVVTQAARDALREQGTASPSAVVHYLSPSRWEHTLRNQFASFQWAVDVRAFGPALHGTNPLVALLAKPIPRQLWPGKPNGLGERFTSVVYPSAAAAGVHFAVPLYAELDLAAGAIGAIGGFALLGVMLALGMRAAARRPRPWQPVARCLFLWSAFVLIRGDLSNSVPLAIAAILPVGLIGWWSRVEEPRRLIIDALAVPPSYSGVGETVRRIGADLVRRGDILAAEIVVRCPVDVREVFERSFPRGTSFDCPIASSRPAARRLAHQLLFSPLRDRRSSMILSTSEIGTWWGRSWRAMIVHDLRRLTAPETASSGQRRLYNTLVPLAVKSADAILTVSATTERTLREELRPEAEITVVAPHSGLVVNQPEAETRSRDLVVVSAVRAYKGADLVLDALELLEQTDRPKIAWVGALELGDEQAEALRTRAAGVGLELVGWLADEALASVLDSAGGLLAPSSFEGYGLSLLEGLRRAKPVLASDIPAHREVAADAACYFDPFEPAALAQLLKEFSDGGIDLEHWAELSHARATELSNAHPSWAEALTALWKAVPSAGHIEHRSPSPEPAGEPAGVGGRPRG
jgi:glycosyltransferase involved in cell wall biosynthesis